MTDDRLDIGVEQTQRLLDSQLSSVDAIQTKIGVLLGFASTSVVILFSFGRDWAVSHFLVAGTSALALLAAVSIFGISMMIEDYSDSPRPDWLVGLINDGETSTNNIKEKMIGNSWGAYDHNRRLIQKRFKMVNVAVILMIIGTGIFVVGVLIT